MMWQRLWADGRAGWQDGRRERVQHSRWWWLVWGAITGLWVVKNVGLPLGRVIGRWVVGS